MRWVCCCLFLLFPCITWANADLASAIDGVRTACGGISSELNQLKKMAGINTAVTSVGTVAGGVALGTGIAKAKIDEKAEELENLTRALEMAGAKKITSLEMFYETYADALAETGTEDGAEFARQLRGRKSALEQKSKKLGNWRTGMMATATATNVAGAVIAGGNKIQGDLKKQVYACMGAVKNLSNVRMQVYILKTATDIELNQADEIIRACGAWNVVDIDSVNAKSDGATISSGVGAGLGLVGTITSAIANSDKVRAGDAKKEKDLNTASNVLAGGTTVASGVAVIFSATQIGVIKRAVQIAENCQEVLK